MGAIKVSGDAPCKTWSQSMRLPSNMESRRTTRMALSYRIRLNPRLWLHLCLWLSCGTLPSPCVAYQSTPHHADLQVSIAAQPITLPIVDAQDNRFLRLSTSEGISQTKVDSIVQDNQGFMWFGTRFGLYRYDGYTFKVFVYDAGNPNSLDGMVVRALFKDRDGVLWVACDQSLDKFDQTTETFKRYPIPLVSHITQDTAGLLWLSTSSGLFCIEPASGRIQRYFHDPNLPSSLSSNDVRVQGIWTNSIVEQGRSHDILFYLMYPVGFSFTRITSAYSGFFTVPLRR